MTIRYFKNINTIEELRKEYVRLLKVNHPDNGGDVEICKVINMEYDYLVVILLKEEKQDATGSGKDFKVDQALRDILDKIVVMNGLNIEVVGSWIWCDGNSYQYKEELKSYGFQWSKARKKWHFTPYSDGWHKGQKKDFNELRRKYGSLKVANDIRECIA